MMDGYTQEKLIEWEAKYAKHVRPIQDLNANRSHDEQVKIASIRDCMDANDLHALCIAEEIEGADTVEVASNDKVKAWFDKSISKHARDLSDSIKTAISSLKYKVNSAGTARADLTSYCRR